MQLRLLMNDYYKDKYLAYHRKTFLVDPSLFLAPFVSKLKKGCHVLDLGCGSGRDLLWLKKRGFKVTGFERSKGLADLAKKNADCEVIEGDFETYDFSQITVDAILMSGSFVHIPHSRLAKVLRNITRALHPVPPMEIHRPMLAYISLKQGSGAISDEEGRKFYLWKEPALSKLLVGVGFEVIDLSISESAVDKKDTWLGYVLKFTGQ